MSAAPVPHVVQVARPDPVGSPLRFLVSVARGTVASASVSPVALCAAPAGPGRVSVAGDGSLTVDIGAVPDTAATQPVQPQLPVPNDGLRNASVSATVAAGWAYARIHVRTDPGCPAWSTVPLPLAGTFDVVAVEGVAYAAAADGGAGPTDPDADAFFVLATFDVPGLAPVVDPCGC